MKALSIFFYALLVVILTEEAKPQALHDKIPIEVQLQTADPLGTRLGYAVKENIRKSSRYEMTSSSGPRLVLGIVTMNPTPFNSNGEGGAVYSTTLMFDDDSGVPAWSSRSFHLDTINIWAPFFIKGWLGVCGEEKIESVANDILADIDKEVDFRIKNCDVYRGFMIWKEIK